MTRYRSGDSWTTAQDMGIYRLPNDPIPSAHKRQNSVVPAALAGLGLFLLTRGKFRPLSAEAKQAEQVIHTSSIAQEMRKAHPAGQNPFDVHPVKK